MRATIAATAAFLAFAVATAGAGAQTAGPTGPASGSAAAPVTGVEQSAIVP